MARILLAEGNIQLRSFIRALIETRKGWQVCAEASSGDDAVTKALHVKPDLVVLDFAMVGLNGLQAASKILAARPDLPIILHTFYGFAAMIDEAKKVGIRHVVDKAEHGNALLDAIEKHLDRRASPAALLSTEAGLADNLKDKYEPPVD